MTESLEFSEFKIIDKNYSRVGKNKYVLSEEWKNNGHLIYNFESKINDVFVMTMPRSGTTVTLEMVWLLINNLDYESAKKIRLEERIIELELCMYPERWFKAKVSIQCESDPTKFTTVDYKNIENYYEIYKNINTPRVIKTHLPFSLHKNILNSGAKTVYIARNPKDRLVSWWRFLTNGDKPLGKFTFEEFWNLVKNNEMTFEPYWSHVKEGWNLRNNKNVLFLYYEDLRMNLFETIKKISIFLDKYYSDEEINGLVCHLDIDKFRNNSMVNTITGLSIKSTCFIGQGKIGGYKDVISDDINKEIDEWIQENLKNCDIVFPSLKI